MKYTEITAAAAALFDRGITDKDLDIINLVYDKEDAEDIVIELRKIYKEAERSKLRKVWMMTFIDGEITECDEYKIGTGGDFADENTFADFRQDRLKTLSEGGHDVRIRWSYVS